MLFFVLVSYYPHIFQVLASFSWCSSIPPSKTSGTLSGQRGIHWSTTSHTSFVGAALRPVTQGHSRSPGVGLLGLKMIPSIWIRMAMRLTVFNHRTTQRTTIQKDRTMHVQDSINLDDVCPMISRFSTLQSILGLQWCKKAPRHQVQMPSTQRIQSLHARGPGSGLMPPWMVPKNSLKHRGVPWFTQQTYGWNFPGEWWGSYEGDGYHVIKHGQLRNPMLWGIMRVLMGNSSINGGVSSEPCLIVGGQCIVITSCHRFFLGCDA